MSLLNWFVGSILLAFSLFLSFVVSSENSLASEKTRTPPDQEAVRQLNLQINAKAARLQLLQEKIHKLNRTIAELNVQRGELKLKYNDLLQNLRGSLTKCQKEYQNLHFQIDNMIEEKNNLNEKLLEHNTSNSNSWKLRVYKRPMDMAVEFASTYKVLVLGDSNVGKTCIVHRFCDERYYDTYISTIGVDFKQKIIQINGVPIKMQIWDTAGQERFRTLTTAYYRGAMGILLMYDITSTESFNNLGYWLKNIKENASQDVVRVLAGNKCEDAAHRAVKTEDGQKIANDFNIPFYEVSCKENINVDEVFLSLAREIKKQRESRGFLNDFDEIDTCNLNTTKTNFLESWKNCASC